MQGNAVFQNLDIYAAVGANTALVKGADIIVTDGKATIEFDSLVNNAKVNAIEITQTVGAPELKLNFMYPDGTPVSGTLNYNIVTTSSTMGGKQPLASGQATCLLVASPQLLGLVGYDECEPEPYRRRGPLALAITLSLNPATANFTSVQSSSAERGRTEAVSFLRGTRYGRWPLVVFPAVVFVAGGAAGGFTFGGGRFIFGRRSIWRIHVHGMISDLLFERVTFAKSSAGAPARAFA